MTPRVAKGVRWAKSVLLYVGIFAGVKAFFALGSASPGENLGYALVLFVSYSVLLGPIAFLLGWFTGHQKDSSSDLSARQVSTVATHIGSASTAGASGSSSPRFCSQCGVKLPNEAAFCSACGQKVK